MLNKPTLLQYTKILQQYLTRAGTKSSTYVDLRDQFMAENVKWIYDLEGGKKIFLWEHNQHIMKTKDNLGFTPMGQHLQTMYGEGYYALGLCFGNGTFRAANMSTQKFEEIKLQTQLENSVEEFLAKAEESSFIIDFASLEKSQALNTHFQKSFRMKSFGEIFSPKRERFYYSESVLPKGFDGILYIDQTTGTRGLDLKKVWKE